MLLGSATAMMGRSMGEQLHATSTPILSMVDACSQDVLAFISGHQLEEELQFSFFPAGGFTLFADKVKELLQPPHPVTHSQLTLFLYVSSLLSLTFTKPLNLNPKIPCHRRRRMRSWRTTGWRQRLASHQTASPWARRTWRACWGYLPPLFTGACTSPKYVSTVCLHASVAVCLLAGLRAHPLHGEASMHDPPQAFQSPHKPNPQPLKNIYVPVWMTGRPCHGCEAGPRAAVTGGGRGTQHPPARAGPHHRHGRGAPGALLSPCCFHLSQGTQPEADPGGWGCR